MVLSLILRRYLQLFCRCIFNRNRGNVRNHGIQAENLPEALKVAQFDQATKTTAGNNGTLQTPKSGTRYQTTNAIRQKAKPK